MHKFLVMLDAACKLPKNSGTPAITLLMLSSGTSVILPGCPHLDLPLPDAGLYASVGIIYCSTGTIACEKELDTDRIREGIEDGATVSFWVVAM